MARIPLVDEADHPELAGLVERIKAGRRGNLVNVYRLLLHSPAVAEGWMGLIDAIRRGTVLDGRTREIAIIRVGHLNRSAYELRQHVPRLATAEGLSLAECEAIGAWPATGLFGERDSAVLAYTDAVTRDIAVPEPVFEALRPHFSVREIVELTVVIATYNMHGRFIEPLEIDLEPR